MSSSLDIGKKLVDFCKLGKSLDAINTLYADDIVSVEPMAMPGDSAEKKGIAAIRGKHDWWNDNHQVHSAVVNGPFPHGDRFIVHFKYDVTATKGPMKDKRFTMEEGALYTGKNGKIAKEEFFYSMGG
ncbi:hypothetical protein BH10PLA1_BH10PLA1_18440 [soil metagenome]